MAVAAGAVTAATSPAAPTGGRLADAIIVAAAVAVVTYAAASAPWGVLTFAAAVAAATVGDARWIAVGAGAGALALIAGWRRRGPGAWRGVSAGLTLVALANSQLGVRLGLSTAVAAIVGIVLLAGGWRRHPPILRRRARWAFTVVAVVTVAAVGLLAAAAWTARTPLADGKDRAEAGLRAVRAGDYDDAADLFAAAADLFGDANERLSQPWVIPSGAVPVAAQHRRLALHLTAEGAAASRIAAEALTSVDVDRLRLEGGRFDIATISELAAPLADLDQALESMAVAVGDESSPWLLPQVDDLLGDLRGELVEADARLDDAALAVAVAPRLLGGEGEQRYLVVFTTPVEARALGFPGNYAELLMNDGHVAMTDFGRVAALEHAGVELGLRLTGPDGLLGQYRRFVVRPDDSVGVATWRNLTMTPDFPTAAAAMADLYGQITGRPVDGVLLVDPHVVAVLLGYAGAVELPSTGTTLHRSNALEYILIGQYTGGDNDDRVDALDEAAQGAMHALLAGALPDPVELASDLAPLVGEGRLLFWAADPDVAELARRTGLDGAFPVRDGADGFVVTIANASGNKIDYFLDRAFVYDAETGENGTTTATLSATLTNNAPADGLPDYVIGNVVDLPTGASRLYVSFYSPLELRRAAVDGEHRNLDIGVEGDWNVYSTFVTIGSGEQVTVELELGGRLEDPGRVVTWEQPLVRPADVRIDVRVPE